MNKIIQRQTWLSAIDEAAHAQEVPLPSFIVNGMGSARSAPGADGRFVTMKRRLVPMAQAELDGVEWALWREQDDVPTRVAAFREPLDPKEHNVAMVMAILRGWLIDQWTIEEAQAEVAKHPRAQAVAERPESGEQQRGAEICSV